MRLPRTTTLLAALAALILLLTALTVAPGVGVPEDLVPPTEILGYLLLFAIILATLLLVRRMPR